jgi:hypothetical protein
MNELALESLRRLQRETGASLQLEDFELVRDLVDAVEGAVNADPAPACAALLMPCLRVGNVTLWRLSHGAKLFFEREILAKHRKDVRYCNLAYAWCLAHSREPETLWNLSGDDAAIRKAVRRWERGVGVSEDALMQGVERLLKTVESLYKSGGKGPRQDLSAWIAEVARETGRPLEDLLWRIPEEELLLLLTLRPNDEGGPIDADSPEIRAIHTLREAERKIRETLEARK